jgi:DNA repair exonuclease SbcCD nuclease subunit
MSLRILATADLHLGMRFGGYPELQARLTEARFTALEKLVALANQRDCGLLLVAGDLFEKLSLPQREIQRAAEVLKGFEGEAVAILPGNHDYYTGAAGNPWKSFREKAADRVLLLSEPRVYDLAHYGLAVRLYPGPCTGKHSRTHALGWLAGRPSAEDGGEEARAADRPLRIGLAHGAVEGYSPDEQGEYYPMRRSELESAGMDFWIVGHTHRPQSDPDCCLFIPGTPEPDGFDCEHAGSVLLLEAEAGRVKAERLETGTFRFRRQTLELAEGQEPASAFAGFHGPEYSGTLLRLALRGSLETEALRRAHEERDRLKQAVAWLETDEAELRERITAEKVEAEFARGSFPWLLLHHLLKAGQPEALEQAYELLREARG